MNFSSSAKFLLTVGLIGTVLGGIAFAQGPPPASVAPSSAMGPTSDVAPSSNAAPSSSAASSSPVAPGTAIAPAAAPANDADLTSADAPDNTIDPATLLPALPELRSRKISLVGGRVERLDRLRDEFTLQIFGGGEMKIYFDPRTHIYNDGAEAPVSELRTGDRVSIDTALDGSTVFARSIRLKNAGAGESQGTVVSYRSDGDKSVLVLRDALSPNPMKLHLSSQTRLLDHERTVSTNELIPGTMVAVKFGPQENGFNPAREISVLATPGAGFTFAGRVIALDLSTGLLVLTAATDGKTYEIYLDPSVTVSDNLLPSADVIVSALFDGKRYVARTVTVN